MGTAPLLPRTNVQQHATPKPLLHADCYFCRPAELAWKYMEDWIALQSMLAHLGAVLRDNPVEAEELDKEGVRVLLHMCHVLGEELQQQLHFPLWINTGMPQTT